MGKEAMKRSKAEGRPTEDEIDSILEGTFPASDPPSWTMGIKQSDAPIGKKQRDDFTYPLETVVVARMLDLIGGFKVRRALPSEKRSMVGPFIFLDQMGPESLEVGAGFDLPPHPHIGLSAVTYLFEGELLHRDSLGTVQTIRPGEVNWMTAGKGIVHSESAPKEIRHTGSRLFGIQSWVAMPVRYEETEPFFVHHGKDELPVIEGEGKRVRLIAGSLYGETSPLRTLSEMFYAEAHLVSGAILPVPVNYKERAAYIIEGSVSLKANGESIGQGTLLVIKPGEHISLHAVGPSPALLMLLGGEPMEGPRHIWRNFVSSSKDRIEQAKADWKEGRFLQDPMKD